MAKTAKPSPAEVNLRRYESFAYTDAPKPLKQPKPLKPLKQPKPPKPPWQVSVHLVINGHEHDIGGVQDAWLGQMDARLGGKVSIGPGDLAEFRAHNPDTGESQVFEVSYVAFNIIAEEFDTTRIIPEMHAGSSLEAAVRLMVDTYEFGFGQCQSGECVAERYIYESRGLPVYPPPFECPDCGYPTEAPFLVGHITGLDASFPADFLNLDNDGVNALRDQLTLKHPPLARSGWIFQAGEDDEDDEDDWSQGARAPKKPEIEKPEAPAHEPAQASAPTLAAEPTPVNFIDDWPPDASEPKRQSAPPAPAKAAAAAHTNAAPVTPTPSPTPAPAPAPAPTPAAKPTPANFIDDWPPDASEPKRQPAPPAPAKCVPELPKAKPIPRQPLTGFGRFLAASSLFKPEGSASAATAPKSSSIFNAQVSERVSAVRKTPDPKAAGPDPEIEAKLTPPAADNK